MLQEEDPSFDLTKFLKSFIPESVIRSSVNFLNLGENWEPCILTLILNYFYPNFVTDNPGFLKSKLGIFLRVVVGVILGLTLAYLISIIISEGFTIAREGNQVLYDQVLRIIDLLS